MPAPTESTSTQLIRDAQANLPEAWHRFYHVYSPLVQKWCVKRGLNEVDSADVVQEVFLRLSRYLKSYEYDKERARFRTWFHVVTLNCIRDLARAQQGKPVAEGGTAAHSTLLDIAEHDEQSDITESEQADALITQRIMSLIQTDFTEQTWTAFIRSTVHGEPTADIAKSLGLTSGAIRQAKSRVLRRLRQELAELG